MNKKENDIPSLTRVVPEHEAKKVIARKYAQSAARGEQSPSARVSAQEPVQGQAQGQAQESVVGNPTRTHVGPGNTVSDKGVSDAGALNRAPSAAGVSSSSAIAGGGDQDRRGIIYSGLESAINNRNTGAISIEVDDDVNEFDDDVNATYSDLRSDSGNIDTELRVDDLGIDVDPHGHQQTQPQEYQQQLQPPELQHQELQQQELPQQSLHDDSQYSADPQGEQRYGENYSGDQIDDHFDGHDEHYGDDHFSNELYGKDPALYSSNDQTRFDPYANELIRQSTLKQARRRRAGLYVACTFIFAGIVGYVVYFTDTFFNVDQVSAARTLADAPRSTPNTYTSTYEPVASNSRASDTKRYRVIVPPQTGRYAAPGSSESAGGLSAGAATDSTTVALNGSDTVEGTSFTTDPSSAAETSADVLTNDALVDDVLGDDAREVASLDIDALDVSPDPSNLDAIDLDKLDELIEQSQARVDSRFGADGAKQRERLTQDLASDPIQTDDVTDQTAPSLSDIKVDHILENVQTALDESVVDTPEVDTAGAATSIVDTSVVASIEKPAENMPVDDAVASTTSVTPDASEDPESLPNALKEEEMQARIDKALKLAEDARDRRLATNDQRAVHDNDQRAKHDEVIAQLSEEDRRLALLNDPEALATIERLVEEKTLAAQAEAESRALERIEQARLEAERLAEERVARVKEEAREEAERLAAERVAAVRAEMEAAAEQQVVAARLEAEEQAKVRASEEAERTRKEMEELAEQRAAEVRAEAEREAQARIDKVREEGERTLEERLAKARVEAEQLARKEVEAAQAGVKIADEQARAEQAKQIDAATEKLVEERVAQVRAQAEQLTAERIASVRAQAEEQAEQRAAAAEKQAAERVALARAEVERLVAAKAEAERVANEKELASQLEAKELQQSTEAEVQRLAAEQTAQAKAAADELMQEANAEVARLAEENERAKAQAAELREQLEVQQRIAEQQQQQAETDQLAAQKVAKASDTSDTTNPYELLDSLLTDNQDRGGRVRPNNEAAPVTETLSADPVTEQTRRNAVKLLLDEAQEYFDALALTTPKGENALESWEAVLAIDPSNNQAKRGIDNIVAAYERWAQTSIARGEYEHAETYYQRAQQIRPESSALQLKLVSLQQKMRLEGIEPTSEPVSSESQSEAQSESAPAVVAIGTSDSSSDSTSDTLSGSNNRVATVSSSPVVTDKAVVPVVLSTQDQQQNARARMAENGIQQTTAEFVKYVRQGDAQVAALFLDAGFTPDSRDGSNGFTPLLAAAMRGDLDMVGLLLGRGANPNLSSFDGRTALMAAAWEGHVEVVDALVSSSILVNAASRDGWTAMHYAAWKGHSDVVARLLEAGADPNRRNSEGWNAPETAQLQGHKELVELLLENSRSG